MLHTKFQASERSGPEEEEKYFFYVSLCFEPRAPVAVPS